MPGIIEDLTEETKPERTPPAGDGLFPDAPVRGDEQQLSEAAREVWSDAQQLGFEDELSEPVAAVPDAVVEAEASLAEIDDEETDVLDLNLEIDSGSGASLEVPDVNEEPDFSDVSEVLEEFEELEEPEDFEEPDEDIPDAEPEG